MKKTLLVVVTITLCATAVPYSHSFSLKSLKLKKPKITYQKHKVRKVTYTDTRVDFIYSVDNPNRVGLKKISARYKLYLGYKRKPAATPPFARGNIKFNVKAKGRSPFVLPVTINYKGFFKSTAKLTKAILRGKKSIPFVLETTFVLNLKVLKFKIPITTKGRLPLPKVKRKLF